MQDKQGRPYVKIAELQADAVIEIDTGFTCADPGTKIVHRDRKGLYFICSDGRHYLDGQADDGVHCVGVYHAA